MFFVDANIPEVIKLDNEENNRRYDIVAGIICGGISGVAVAIVSFLLLNIWFLLFPPINTSLVLLSIVIVWTGYGMLATALYKPPLRAIYKNISFFIGMLAAVGIMNYFYNILTYNIDLPYDSLRTIRIVALVLIGSSIGLALKMVAESKGIINEETTQ